MRAKVRPFPWTGIALVVALSLGASGAKATLTPDEGAPLSARTPILIDLAQVQCRFTGVWISGDEKTCYYICAGIRETRKVSTADLCPEHVTKQ